MNKSEYIIECCECNKIQLSDGPWSEKLHDFNDLKNKVSHGYCDKCFEIWKTDFKKHKEDFKKHNKGHNYAKRKNNNGK